LSPPHHSSPEIVPQREVRQRLYKIIKLHYYNNIIHTPDSRLVRARSPWQRICCRTRVYTVCYNVIIYYYILYLIMIIHSTEIHRELVTRIRGWLLFFRQIYTIIFLTIKILYNIIISHLNIILLKYFDLDR